MSKEWFEGERKEKVILIQDAHAISSAQKSIASLIHHFENQYGVSLITLEGASTPLDPELLQNFPDKELLKQTLESYFESGELTGTTLASVFSPKTTLYHGIEDWHLYEEGLTHYQEAMRVKESILSQLKTQKDNLQLEKTKAYSKKQLELDSLIESFQNNELNLILFLKSLSAFKAPSKDSELSLILKEASKDQTSFELEVKKLANEMKQIVRATHASPLRDNQIHGSVADVVGARHASPVLDKESLITFNQHHQDFLTSRSSAQSFALYLKDLSESLNLSFPLSSALLEATRNERRMRDLEGTRLFSELQTYIESIKEELFQNRCNRYACLL